MMQQLKDAYRRMFPRVKAPPIEEKPTLEQMKEVIDQADEFDKLQLLPVWEKILKRLGAEVQAELVEATKFKYEPVRQTAHTVRWDAKRELLDNLLGWMESTQVERERIIEEFREMRNGRHTNDTV
jgi:hypothetical protein